MASFSFIITRPPNPPPPPVPPPSSAGAGAGGGSVSDHEAASNPHPQYLTEPEGDARYTQFGHVHVAANITDFAEAVDDRVAALLAFGAGIGLSYNDVANSLTISNTDRGSVAVTAHEALSDPHPQYLTAAEGNAAYSLLGHTHTASQVTDFSEAVDDRVGALLAAGAGVSLNYDDALNALTVTNSDRGSAAVSTHVGLSDPHTQYALESALGTMSTQSAADYVLKAGDTMTGNLVAPRVVGNLNVSALGSPVDAGAALWGIGPDGVNTTVELDSYGAGTNLLSFYKANGTKATPAATSTALAQLNFFGHNGTAFSSGSNARLRVAVVGTHSGSNAGTRFEFDVTPGASTTRANAVNVDSTGVVLATGRVLTVGSSPVVGARKTGWSVPTGTLSRTTFDPSTVTALQVAQTLAALITDLHATVGHGLIGT